MRFFEGEGKELLPRKDQQFQLSQIVSRMKAALAKDGRSSAILPLIEPETAVLSSVALSQACFWTGELVIGGVPGVVKTEAGWLKGREVTLVSYDATKVSQEAIVAHAKKNSCADQVYGGADLRQYRPARESDQKRQLQGTRFAKVDNLSAYQKTKLNAFARGNPEKAMEFLTPQQKARL